MRFSSNLIPYNHILVTSYNSTLVKSHCPESKRICCHWFLWKLVMISRRLRQFCHANFAFPSSHLCCCLYYGVGSLQKFVTDFVPSVKSMERIQGHITTLADICRLSRSVQADIHHLHGPFERKSSVPLGFTFPYSIPTQLESHPYCLIVALLVYVAVSSTTCFHLSSCCAKETLISVVPSFVPLYVQGYQPITSFWNIYPAFLSGIVILDTCESTTDHPSGPS